MARAVEVEDSEPESLMAEGERGRCVRGEEVKDGAARNRCQHSIQSYASRSSPVAAGLTPRLVPLSSFQCSNCPCIVAVLMDRCQLALLRCNAARTPAGRSLGVIVVGGTVAGPAPAAAGRRLDHYDFR